MEALSTGRSGVPESVTGDRFSPVDRDRLGLWAPRSENLDFDGVVTGVTMGELSDIGGVFKSIVCSTSLDPLNLLEFLCDFANSLVSTFSPVLSILSDFRSDVFLALLSSSLPLDSTVTLSCTLSSLSLVSLGNDDLRLLVPLASRTGVFRVASSSTLTTFLLGFLPRFVDVFGVSSSILSSWSSVVCARCLVCLVSLRGTGLSVDSTCLLSRLR